MSNLRTHCESCGAPVDFHAKECAYCGTPYLWTVKPQPALALDSKELAQEVVTYLEHGLITVNEARRRLGLEEVQS